MASDDNYVDGNPFASRFDHLKNGERKLTQNFPDVNEREFFVADLHEFTFKGDQITMEVPIFSLSTKTDNKLWKWESKNGQKTVEVAPGFYGRATQLDKDVLIYCVSQLIAGKKQGRNPSRFVRFTAYDFLIATGRSTTGGEYNRLKDMLNRLKGTQITTNIVSGKTKKTRGFGLIDSWSVVERSEFNGRMVGIEVQLSDWMFSAIHEKNVLTINPSYFMIRKPIERKLYEIARKHLGKQKSWDIGLELLKDKCGSTVFRLRQFKAELKKIIEEDALLDYRLRLVGEKVFFHQRDVNQLLK